MKTQTVAITIPDGLDFSELKLARDADGMVSFDWTPIARICEASNLDISVLRDQPEDNVAELITAWYLEHLERGGAPDPVQEDLINEARLENAHGGGISYPPGRA